MLTAVQIDQVIVQHVLADQCSHNFPIKIIFSIFSITFLTQSDQREKFIVFCFSNDKNNSLPDFKDGAISEKNLSNVISWTQPRAEN